MRSRLAGLPGACSGQGFLPICHRTTLISIRLWKSISPPRSSFSHPILDPRLSAAVVNGDDDYGRRIIENGTRALKVIRYSGKVPAGPGVATGADDVFVEKVRFAPGGITARVHTSRGVIRVDSPLMGRLNLYNILAAISAAVSLDIAPEAIEEGIRSAFPRGRAP